MAICIFDFILAPSLNYIFFGRMETEFQSWKPLTMTDGGLFHVAMGAIIGVTAWQRGEEKKSRYRYEYQDEYYEQPEDRAAHRDRISRDTSREDRP
jgi:hypothetical protein